MHRIETMLFAACCAGFLPGQVGDEVAAWLADGRAKAEKKEFRAALPLLDKVVGAQPENVVALRWRGHCRTALGMYDRALADLDIAVRLGPDDAWTFYARGMAHHHLDRRERAIADYGRALALDPKNHKAVEWRGFNHAQLGDHLSAWADFSRAVELDGKNPWVYLARARAALALSATDHAERDLRRALELAPEDADAHEQLGFLQASRGADTKALAHFDKALALDGRDRDYARLWRYWLVMKRGKPDIDAVRDLPERGWPAELGKVLSGAMDRVSLLQRVAGYGVDTAALRARECEAYFYLALRARLAARPIHARELLQEAIVRGDATMPEWRAARELARAR